MILCLLKNLPCFLFPLSLLLSKTEEEKEAGFLAFFHAHVYNTCYGDEARVSELRLAKGLLRVFFARKNELLSRHRSGVNSQGFDHRASCLYVSIRL